MNRLMHLLAAVFAVVLLAAACGSDSSEDTLAELGLSSAESECLTREYEARGLDVDRVLTSDSADDFSTEEQEAVIEVAGICLSADSGTSTDADDSDTDDSNGDSPDADDSADGSGRSYDDLGFLERAFVDGMAESGVGQDAAVCIIDEFEAAGISITDLAALGMQENAEPPADFMAAIFRCGDELAESGLFGEDMFGDGFLDEDFLEADSDGDAYGDDPELDALWDACAAGDGTACDDLFWTSPIGSEYEAFGDTCGDRFPDGVLSCATELDSSVTTGDYGDDPTLDALYDGCASGDMTACDDLYWQSPIDSAYEEFGRTCGATTAPNAGGCAGGMDLDEGEPMAYGDDPEFDALWDACATGDDTACDELYWNSPVGSVYESYGSTCGARSTEETFGNCAPAG